MGAVGAVGAVGVERRERKHLADAAEIAVIRSRLARLLRPDPHGRDGVYHVRSLYLDTPRRDAVFEKLGGVRDRHKWRLRIYDRRDDRIRLERKVRRDRWVRKDAVVIDRDTADRVIRGLAPLHHVHPLVRALAVEQRAVGLRSAVIVEYLRQAWIHRVGDVRITLDQRLRSGGWRLDLFAPDPPVIPVLDGPRRTIVEIKHTRWLPAHLEAMLPPSLPAADALSKYVLCCRAAPLAPWEDP